MNDHVYVDVTQFTSIPEYNPYDESTVYVVLKKGAEMNGNNIFKLLFGLPKSIIYMPYIEHKYCIFYINNDYFLAGTNHSFIMVNNQLCTNAPKNTIQQATVCQELICQHSKFCQTRTRSCNYYGQQLPSIVYDYLGIDYKKYENINKLVPLYILFKHCYEKYDHLRNLVNQLHIVENIQFYYVVYRANKRDYDNIYFNVIGNHTYILPPNIFSRLFELLFHNFDQNADINFERLIEFERLCMYIQEAKQRSYFDEFHEKIEKVFYYYRDIHFFKLEDDTNFMKSIAFIALFNGHKGLVINHDFITYTLKIATN